MTANSSPASGAPVVLTEFLSLDGVSQAPGGPQEDPTDGFRLGGWVVPHFDADLGAEIGTTFGKAGGFLLGRRTYDIFASHWPHVTDPNDSVARQLNSLPKFVASRSTTRFSWQGTTGLRDVVAGLAAVRKQVTGELQVHGSGNLVQTLIQHDLIDEYRLAVFPVLLGSGRRLFNTAIPSDLQLVSSRTTSKGVVYCVYRKRGRLKTGDVVLNADGTYKMVES